MIVTVENARNPKIFEQVEIDFYTAQLLRYMEDYQIELNATANRLSQKANEKAKIVIAHDIFPENIEIKRDYNRIVDKIGGKTRVIVSKYLRATMFMLGNICECIVIDNCKRNPILNRKFINYACFAEDINEVYGNLDYNIYTPFSPSHKRIVLYTNGGIVHYSKNIYAYEPNHINKDILWCEKDSLENILKAHIPYTNYDLPAKLQVKSSTCYSNIDWNEEKYRFSPIVYFDLYRDIDKLCQYLEQRRSGLFVRSVVDFDLNLLNEAMWYFKLLSAHFAGLIDLRSQIDLNSSDAVSRGILKYIFDSDIRALLNDNSVVQSRNLLNALQDVILGNNQKNLINISQIDT